jgi:hypothetical protein
MVSIGACAAAIRGEDASVEILDPDDQMFYAVLKPISDTYLEKALRVTGLDCAQLEQDGREPGETMAQFATWVDDLASAHDAQPVLAAFPLGLVWQFTQHYLHQYAGHSPFGQSAHYDIKTAYATLAPNATSSAAACQAHCSAHGAARAGMRLRTRRGSPTCSQAC